MSDMFTQNQHTARKDYVCNVCSRAIEKGSEYILWKSFIGGTWSKARVHVHCDAFVNEYTTQSWYDGYFDRDLVIEWIKEECCAKCDDWDEDEGCEKSAICCERAVCLMLHPTVQGAAIESIRRIAGDD